MATTLKYSNGLLIPVSKQITEGKMQKNRAQQPKDEANFAKSSKKIYGVLIALTVMINTIFTIVLAVQ